MPPLTPLGRKAFELDTRKLASDIIVAFLAQALSIASSVATTLILPKFLGIESFGYWQLFLFYVSYIGFFHLGINDGVYLINGGESRSRIDKKDINSQFAFSNMYQLVFSALLLLVALFGPFEEERCFVVSTTAILLTINNAGLFLGYLFQAMNETKLFSFSAAIESIVFFSGLIALLILGFTDFKPYVLLYCISKAVRLLYCLTKSKDIISAGVEPLSLTAERSFSSIKVGIKLMISNIVGQLILGVIRFFVDLEWGIEAFSVVSFSLSIASFFLMFLTQVSMVLFPHLKQASRDSVEAYYVLLRNSLSVLLPSLYLLYPPIALLLNLWLPEYSESIQLFIFLFPLCVFEGKMDIVGTTYLKVLRQEKKLLIINCLTLSFSLATTLIGTYLLHSIPFILTCVVFALGARCLIAERTLEKTMRIKHSPVSWTALAISMAYIALFACADQIFAFLSYLLLYVGFFMLNRKSLKPLGASIVKALKRN